MATTLYTEEDKKLLACLPNLNNSYRSKTVPLFYIKRNCG